MRRPRFSVSRLMAAVAFIAVGIAAALAGAFTFAVVVLSGATIGAMTCRGTGRAALLAFAACGWASMIVAFGMGQQVRNSLPTTRPLLRVFEAIHGPAPASFKTPEEAHRWVIHLVASVNEAITVGHSLIALVLASAGGFVAWLTARYIWPPVPPEPE